MIILLYWECREYVRKFVGVCGYGSRGDLLGGINFKG